MTTSRVCTSCQRRLARPQIFSSLSALSPLTQRSASGLSKRQIGEAIRTRGEAELQAARRPSPTPSPRKLQPETQDSEPDFVEPWEEVPPPQAPTSLLRRSWNRIRGKTDDISQPSRETAALADKLRAERETREAPRGDYQPARTWENLEHVGYIAKGLSAEEVEDYGTFAREKVTDQKQLELILYQTLVEIAGLKAAIKLGRRSKGDAELENRTRRMQLWQGNLPLEGLRTLFEPTKLMPQGGEKAIQCRANQSMDMAAEIDQHIADQPAEAAQELWALARISRPTNLTKSSTKKLIKLASAITLTPSERFDLLKQLYFRTGHSPPDRLLPSLTSVTAVRRTLLTAPAPPTTAITLTERTELPLLPNVQLWDRRKTKIDDEIAVGRWKVARKILEERQLPVTRWIEKEKFWVSEAKAGRKVKYNTNTLVMRERRRALVAGEDEEWKAKSGRLARMQEATRKVRVGIN